MGYMNPDFDLFFYAERQVQADPLMVQKAFKEKRKSWFKGK